MNIMKETFNNRILSIEDLLRIQDLLLKDNKETSEIQKINKILLKYNFRWCKKCNTAQSTLRGNYQIKTDGAYQPYCLSCMRKSHAINYKKRQERKNERINRN